MRAIKLLVALAVGAGLAGCASMKSKESAQMGVLRSSNAYEVAGTISRISKDEVTIARPGLPTMKLHVEPSTQVMLNGTNVTPHSLPEGGEVRAKFQLQEDKPIALELDVQSPGMQQGHGGSGRK